MVEGEDRGRRQGGEGEEGRKKKERGEQVMVKNDWFRSGKLHLFILQIIHQGIEFFRWSLGKSSFAQPDNGTATPRKEERETPKREGRMYGRQHLPNYGGENTWHYVPCSERLRCLFSTIFRRFWWKKMVVVQVSGDSSLRNLYNQRKKKINVNSTKYLVPLKIILLGMHDLGNMVLYLLKHHKNFLTEWRAREVRSLS